MKWIEDLTRFQLTREIVAETEGELTMWSGGTIIIKKRAVRMEGEPTQNIKQTAPIFGT